MDLDPLCIVRRRLHEQHLAGPELGSAVEVAGSLVGVQSQEFAEALWSLAQRMEGDVTGADLAEAFDRGEILRTHVLRPTWHFVAPQDVGWLLDLTAPGILRRLGARHAGLELDDAEQKRADGVIAKAVSEGPRTRPELEAALLYAGIATTENNRLAHLVMRAELAKVIVSGPRRGRQHTYAAFAERVGTAGPKLARDDALAELARRYVIGHGPATAADLAMWASLSRADARQGLEAAGDVLARATDDDGTAWFAAAQAETPPARRRRTGALLIPTYDETIMGFRGLRVVGTDRVPPLDPVLKRPIVIDGRTVGGWSRTLTTKSVTVHATLFAALPATGQRALQAAVKRFGRFLERPASLRTHFIE